MSDTDRYAEVFEELYQTYTPLGINGELEFSALVYAAGREIEYRYPQYKNQAGIPSLLLKMYVEYYLNCYINFCECKRKEAINVK